MRRRCASLLILATVLLLVSSKLPAGAFPGQQSEEQLPEGAVPGTGVVRSDSDISKLRVASTQYEIIQVLLDERDFPQIMPEFDRILELDLRIEDQGLIVQSAWNIVASLREARQYSLAHRVVQATLQRVKPNEHRATLLILQGKIYQDQKQNKKALESLRKARELQQTSGERQQPY